MEKITTKQWDSAEFLSSEKDVAAYLNACFEDYGDDPAMIAHALAAVAKARGRSTVAKNKHVWSTLGSFTPKGGR